MKMTDAAVEAVLEVLTRKGLDPARWYLAFGIDDRGSLAMSLDRDSHGLVERFGALRVTTGSRFDSTGVVVDFVEYDGRKGLIFRGESDVDQSDASGAR